MAKTWTSCVSVITYLPIGQCDFSTSVYTVQYQKASVIQADVYRDASINTTELYT